MPRRRGYSWLGSLLVSFVMVLGIIASVSANASGCVGALARELPPYTSVEDGHRVLLPVHCVLLEEEGHMEPGTANRIDRKRAQTTRTD
jgi:hypothetical protein